MSTIGLADVSATTLSGEPGIDEAADALLARFMPNGDPDAPKKKEPSEEGEKTKETTPSKPKPTEEPSEPETPEEPEEDEGEEKPAERKFVDDDEAHVKIKVDDEEREVPVKDLKRLYGQEAALTRKSQDVAEARKKAEAETTKHTTALASLLQRAQEKAKPYASVDWLVAAKELSAEDLHALRQEAQARFEDVKFLETELTGFVQEAQAKQQETVKTQAKACVEALRDPDSTFHIPDWSDKTYGDLRDFAVAEGIAQDIFNQLVDPAAIKIIHMAQQFKRGMSKVQTIKVNKTPKKIVKTTTAPQTSKSDKAAEDKAMGKLRNTGSVDDAAEAFLARWSDASE